MSTLTMKFGGSALATPARMRRAVAITLRETKRWQRVLVVVAALEGVTDQLLTVARLAARRDTRGYRRIINEIRERHLAVIGEILANSAELAAMSAQMDRLLFSLLTDCQASAQRPAALPKWSDRIVAIGEQMVAAIFAALLRQEGLPGVALDAARFLITDEVFGNARPLWTETAARVEAQVLPLLISGRLPVVTGYIGSTLAGEVTTLGRGGSDFTASILGLCLGADEVWLWSSVAGLMSADPALIPTARVIAEIDYADAAELAYYGARVLHLKMIAPLQRAQIPLRVKSIHQPEAAGTHIHSAPGRPATVLGVTSLPGVALWPADEGEAFNGAQEVLPPRRDTYDLLHALERVAPRSLGDVELMLASQSSAGSLWCLCAPASATVEEMVQLGEALCRPARVGVASVWRWGAVTIVTVVGGSLVALENSGALNEKLVGLHVLGQTRGAHPTALSYILTAEDGLAAVARLHETLVPPH